MKNTFKSLVIKILAFEANFLLKRKKPKIIAISGSVGKTSTKDAIFTVISSRFSARKNQKSYNSEYGVPLTILNLKSAWGNPLLWIWYLKLGFLKSIFSVRYPEWLVLEMGSERPGDIQDLAQWVKPDITVLTRFPDIPVHVEYFEKPEDLLEEDFHIAKESKVVIANGDDRNIARLLEDFPHTVIRYGLDPGNDVRAEGDSILYRNEKVAGMSVAIEGNTISVEGAVGFQHIYPVLAAYAVGRHLGMDQQSITDALKKHRTPPGRMCLIDGIKHTQLIDDTYNSSPVAVEEALATLHRIETSGRKIAILGDMRELGKYSSDLHYEAGKRATGVCHLLVTVGMVARTIAEGALSNGMNEKDVFQFDTAEEAGSFIQNLLKEKDLVLIKGSQGVRMEKITKELMEHPNLAEKLLVRQERAWQKR